MAEEKPDQTKVDGWNQATSGDVVKFEKDGDAIEGKLIGFEPSRQYPDSYAVKVDTKDGIKIVFVSGIVVDLISSNSLKKGQEIKIVYKGKKRNKKDTADYNDYELLYK